MREIVLQYREMTVLLALLIFVVAFLVIAGVVIALTGNPAGLVLFSGGYLLVNKRVVNWCGGRMRS